VEDSWGNSAELFDEEIVDDGTGNNVWRASNALTNGSYSNQPFSSKPAQVAGETGAGLYNDYGTNHTMPNNPPLSSATATNKYFYGAWDFRSATGATQSGLSLTVSPGGTQSTIRMGYVRMDDTGGGYDLVFYDTTGSGFNGPTTIASGLNYTSWHTVEMYVEFVDGIGPGAAGSEAGNDIVTIVLNGSVVHTGTTWESYFYNVADGGPAGAPRAVDSLLFRMAGTAVLGNSGAGFYFDNVETSNKPLAPPAPAYKCVGFEPPMHHAELSPALGGGTIARRVKKNRVFPFKATLVDGDGSVVTDLNTPPVLVVYEDSAPSVSVDITDDSFNNGKRTDGIEFFLAGDKWIHNLASRGFGESSGTYTGTIESGDPSEYIIDPTCEGLFVIEPN
jgi:hypothetical protein